MSPWNSPTPVYALAASREGMPSRAYTLNVRVNRTPEDLERVIGNHKMEVSEIVEGLVLFEEEDSAMIYLDLALEADQVFLVDGPGAVQAMQDSNGVVVVVDEPPPPLYLQEKLLSIAYDL